MATILAPVIIQKFSSGNGDPLAGGKVFTYVAGTTTLVATYTDSTGATPNANPIILDANGQCDIWINPGFYKFVLKNSLDVVQWTKDQITSSPIDNNFFTGDVKLSFNDVADTGWVLMNDLSIGSVASAATGRANADTENLYIKLWNKTINTWCAVSTGRGASGAADFAAGKTLTLPRTLGRAIAIFGTGSGLTSRVMAEFLGAQTHTLTTAESASHNHTQDAHNHTQDGHGHAVKWGINSVTSLDASQGFAGYTTANGTVVTGTDGAAYIVNTAATNQATTGTNQATGGGGSHNNMQPTLFLNMMIKL